MIRAWYRKRRVIAFFGMMITAALLVAAFIMGLVSFGKMRQVVSREFNQQQLVLARNLATLIREDMDFLQRELLVLNRALAFGNEAGPSWQERMRITVESIQSGELIEVVYATGEGRPVHVMDASGRAADLNRDLSRSALFAWARRKNSLGRVLIVRNEGRYRLPAGRGPSIIMATPLSPGAGGPGAHFGGIAAFVVDASALARGFTREARSGRTGYAWVIDQDGTFLAHPMEDLIGQNAFTARSRKNPKLGFENINLIMRQHMLRGQEGKGEYLSGWHRDLTGPIHKLIGYAPVRLGPQARGLLWSVAVVAPESEVQGMVQSLFMRQFWMQMAIVLAILAGSLSLIWMERYWSDLQKEKERQINLSSRLSSLGTLSAGVAHEINNPIAIIIGFCDLLLEKAAPGSPEFEQLKIIEKQGLACKKIVENLSQFARVPEQRAETTDVNDELRRVIEMVRNTLMTEKIQCVVELQEGLPRVHGDPQGLQQVFLNLLTNAKAAMKRGGRLTVKTRLVEGKVEIAVTDTGTGIRKRDVERVFDPFFTTKEPGRGMGLGLSISHGIVEKAGGTISVESRHEEDAGEQSGTTFRVMLPTVRRRAGAQETDHSQGPEEV